MKYHINSKTGRASQCKASKKECPLGANTPHFSSKIEAKEFIENSEKLKNKDNPIKTFKKIENKKIEEQMSFEVNREAGGDNFTDYLKGKRLEVIEDGDEKKAIKELLKKDFSRVTVFKMSDGSAMAIYGNSGCGGCPAGNYSISNASDYPYGISKIIINKEDVDNPNAYSSDEVYTVEAYSRKKKSPTVLFQVTGNVGSGYYGDGFHVELIPATTIKELLK